MAVDVGEVVGVEEPDVVAVVVCVAVPDVVIELDGVVDGDVESVDVPDVERDEVAVEVLEVVLVLD